MSMEGKVWVGEGKGGKLSVSWESGQEGKINEKEVGEGWRGVN